MNKDSKFELLRVLVAITVAISITFIVIFFVSNEPVFAMKKLLLGPFKSIRTFGNVIELMTPLMFTGIGMIIVFSSKQFNLSADGAFHIGGLIAAIVAMKVSLPFIIHPMFAILLAGVAGIVVTLIPFLIKYKTGANEFVVSLMLNYVCVLFTTFIIMNYFRDPTQGTFASYRFFDTSSLGTLIPKTRIHMGFVVAIVVIIIADIFLNKTTMGYKIRTTGDNVSYAKYIGFNTFKVIIISQIVGGFFLGVGGGIEVLGMYEKFTWQSSMGFGWDGVIVSILAKNKPRLVPLTAFFLAYIRIGAFVMAMSTDVQNEIIYVAQGVIIILVIGEKFLGRYKSRLLYKSAKNKLRGGEA